MNTLAIHIKRLIAILMLVLSVPAFLSAQLRVFTIGDSTVQDYNDGYAPRKGWGQMLPFFFDKSKAVCYNKAVEPTFRLSTMQLEDAVREVSVSKEDGRQC